MNSSNISSEPKQAATSSEATRKSFALDGPSVAIDRRTQAVRRDLADIRLADRVFAPHYAAPMMMVVLQPTSLREAGGADAAAIADLSVGASFEALDFAGSSAWGIAVAAGLVGYVDRSAVGLALAVD